MCHLERQHNEVLGIQFRRTTRRWKQTDIATPVSVSFGSKIRHRYFCWKVSHLCNIKRQLNKVLGCQHFRKAWVRNTTGESFYTTPQSVTGLGSQRPLDTGLGTYHTCSVLANNTPMLLKFTTTLESWEFVQPLHNSGLSTPQYVLKRTDMEFQTILASAFDLVQFQPKKSCLLKRSVRVNLDEEIIKIHRFRFISHLTTPHAVEHQNIESIWLRRVE